jgi:NTE family protein
MSLPEEESHRLHELRRAIDCLSSSAALEGVDPSTLEALAEGAEHFSLPAGAVLFEAGAEPDGVYLLASGRLSVRVSHQRRPAGHIERGEWVGESSWLLREPRAAQVVALRDCELLRLPAALLDEIAARSPTLALAIARLSARRLRRSNAPERQARCGGVFALVPNSEEIDVIGLAGQLVEELNRFGRAELVWDARATAHTSAWFNRIEELNDYVVYVADVSESAWTRQCCRQADVIVAVGRAAGPVRPWSEVLQRAAAGGVRVELALLHDGVMVSGAATHWLDSLPIALHHHLVEPTDLGRFARLLTHRGVGLVLSGGGARGFAHLGVIRALREAQVPLDFVGGASIGGLIAAGVAMGWSDEEMRARYHRSFVATNPVNDYTFPLVALTRGRKVSRLLEREFGSVLIEDLRIPFFCVSANLASGRLIEQRGGRLSQALRAAVAIPGVLPPVFQGDAVLIDGAALNNLPVDVMRQHMPGYVIGSDAGADYTFDPRAVTQGPPLWRWFERAPSGKRRLNIFQILMLAGMVNTVSSEAARRSLADLSVRPPLGDIDLMNWRAFEHAAQTGYAFTRSLLAETPSVPRAGGSTVERRRSSSLEVELERRLALHSLEAG